jgi:hypothetical protein
MLTVVESAAAILGVTFMDVVRGFVVYIAGSEERYSEIIERESSGNITAA